MTITALNNLWTYIQTLSLTKKNREWLAARLVEKTEKEAFADETEYISSSQAMLDIIAKGREEIKEMENGKPFEVLDINNLWK